MIDVLRSLRVPQSVALAVIDQQLFLHLTSSALFPAIFGESCLSPSRYGWLRLNFGLLHYSGCFSCRYLCLIEDKSCILDTQRPETHVELNCALRHPLYNFANNLVYIAENCLDLSLRELKLLAQSAVVDFLLQSLHFNAVR